MAQIQLSQMTTHTLQKHNHKGTMYVSMQMYLIVHYKGGEQKTDGVNG
jgi:hypothetical protein